MPPLAEPLQLARFKRFPMLWLASAFAAGILTSQLTETALIISLAVAAAAAIAAGLSADLRLSTVLMALALAAAGHSTAKLELQMVSPDRIKVIYDSGAIPSGEPVELQGTMTGPPEPAVGGEFLTLSANAVRYHGKDRMVSGTVRLFMPETKVSASPVPIGDGPASDIDPASDTADDGQIAQQITDISSLKYGSRIRAFCKLSRDQQYLNPGVVSKPEILDRLGIDATGTVKSHLLIEHLSDESVFVPLAWVYDQRARLIGEFRHNLNAQAAGIMIASLLGDKYFLDKDTAELFREGGTFHVLVISGLHITFIGGLLLLFVRLFTRRRWIQFLVTVAGMWGFSLAVGADLPVVRAAVMFSIVSYAYVIYRQGNALNSLGTSALLLLAYRPSDLLNPSFQLTFVSVAAIVGIAVPLVDRLRRIGSWVPSSQTPFPPDVPQWLRRCCETLYWSEDAWTIEMGRQIWTAKLFKLPYWTVRLAAIFQKAVRYLVEGTLASLIVQLCMVPLMVWYFHRISVSGILLNIWVGVFLAIESFAAVAAACLGQISGALSGPVYAFADFSNWLLLLMPRMFADRDWASFRLPAYTGGGRWIYILYFVPLVAASVVVIKWDLFAFKQNLDKTRLRTAYGMAAAFGILILLIIAHPFSAPRADGRLHFDFLDAGQGDSALVTFPTGETMLVDGGGRPKYFVDDEENDEPFEPDIRSVGEAVVSQYLWYRGYSHIDHLLATHADADHIQGLTDVAGNFDVGDAIFGRTPMRNPNFAEFANMLMRHDVPAELIARGDVLRFGGVTLEVLYPPLTDDLDAASDNDHSVVLRFVYGSRKFLLTGDMERGTETEVLNSGNTVSADLIKVAHHGSRTSSTQQFIDAVGAEYAVISVGRTSPFGHPHPEVVQRWKDSGAKVMRTGDRGTLTVSTNGSDLEVSTFLP